ncbi:MAG: glycosyltransferase family 2 protein [Bacteroidota bacterium]
MADIRITMIVQTYNRAHLVERSIQSILRQTFPHYELLIVDNGSTDDTPQVLEKYRFMERVRVIRLEENIGAAGGFNFCLDQLNRDWFAFVGDDDAITENALEVLFGTLETVDPNLTAISSNGWDSATDDYSGIGLSEDQYLPVSTIVSRCDGDFWGITQTQLIQGIRLNPNIPGLEDTFWYKVDAAARRYYVHQALITYYTDHGPRETNRQGDSMAVKSKLYRELLNEPFFWEVLKKHNPRQFRDRCVKAMHFLKADGELEAFGEYRRMLREERPGLKYQLRSQLIGLLSPGLLTQLYYLKNKVS